MCYLRCLFAQDVYEKIKEKDRNVSQYVKGVTTTLASHCQQGMDGLAQKLQDIEGHLQHLQLSVKSDVDRMTEEAHEVEQQFEEAFQVLISLSEGHHQECTQRF